MEHTLRRANVIRAELDRARALLSDLRFDTGGADHGYALHCVMRLAEELCAAEDAAERMAEAVALKWIYRYTGGSLVAIDGGSASRRP